jgi:hypothetical protein
MKYDQLLLLKKNRNTDLTIKRKGYKEVKSKITFFNILFQHLLRKHYIILILLEKYHYRMPILFRTMPIPSQDHQKLPGLSFSRRIKNYTMSTNFLKKFNKFTNPYSFRPELNRGKIWIAGWQIS